MPEQEEVDNLFTIDEERLASYYHRMKQKFQNLSNLQLAAKFLSSQSIGTTSHEVLEILRHFENKLTFNREIFDFTLEWIRAQKIRLEYKKYLVQTNYPNDDLALAIDDCISCFFLNYDRFLRKLLEKEIKEYEIAALYEIFFNDYVAEVLKIEDILNKYEKNYPQSSSDEPLHINIITLRMGLSNVIVKDYVNILYSRKDNIRKKNSLPAINVDTTEYDGKFRGTLLERIIKTFLIKKGTLEPKELEKSIEQFLNSYFKFGQFYEYPEIIDVLVQSLTEDILTGLTDNFKPLYQESYLKMLISSELREREDLEKYKKLDGIAWINDLKPILKNFLMKFIDRLLDPKNIQVKDNKIRFEVYKNPVIGKDNLKDGESQKQNPLDEIFDLNLNVEQYREKLEELINSMDLTLIQKKALIRSKIQEFRELKRKR